MKGLNVLDYHRRHRPLLYSLLGAYALLCMPSFCQQIPKPLSLAETLGYPRSSRLLIIHAEDLGASHEIDSASFQALQKGWVTSAGVVIPGPWYPEVVEWSRLHPTVDLGVRLDLNAPWQRYKWRPMSNVSQQSGLVDKEGYFGSTEDGVAKRANADAALQELTVQIQTSLDDGLPISHLDNYMRTLIRNPLLLDEYLQLGTKYSLPTTIPKNFVLAHSVPATTPEFALLGTIKVPLIECPVDAVLEIFPGHRKQDWLMAYENSLAKLPPGVYQLSVHLGFDSETLRAEVGNSNWGAEWRQNDFDVVSSPEFASFLKKENFILVSWHQLNSR